MLGFNKGSSRNIRTPPRSSRLSLSPPEAKLLSFDFHARLEISQMKSVNFLSFFALTTSFYSRATPKDAAAPLKAIQIAFLHHLDTQCCTPSNTSSIGSCNLFPIRSRFPLLPFSAHRRNRYRYRRE